jgi:molybdate transport system substrate-binding protein
VTLRLGLHLLCAGAAQGLVKALQARWLGDTGSDVGGRFGAVGAMQEALFAGEPCDVFVSTDKMIGELIDAGRLRRESRAPLGRVFTGIAVRAAAPQPDVATPEALKAALLAADAIYFPDAVRSTAGIHFAGVMRELGLFDLLEPRFRTYPNGATAMREMAAHAAPKLIGCTQVTEILYTAGVELVAKLPARFALATTYTAAVSTSAADPVLAAQFVGLLTGADTHALRQSGGFED